MMFRRRRRASFETSSDSYVDDPTAPFNELNSFDSIWQALRWKEIRTRVPVCFKKTIRNRYMLANIIYLAYAITLLIIDFNPYLNGTSASSNLNGTSSSADYGNLAYDESTTSIPILDQPVIVVPVVNRIYLGFAIVHLISAAIYLWAWNDRSWFDIILIPEYLNHIEAALYVWSAVWYPKIDTLGDFYALAVHKIEMTAATIELVACAGWIMSWYMTYVRTLGRGFTLDDPDTIAYLATTISAIIYFVYNIQICAHPEQYQTNLVYYNGDILIFIGACFYIFAALRDDHWFWFLPMAGQYGVAPGKIKIETEKVLPSEGLTPILITDACRRCRRPRHSAKLEQTELATSNGAITTSSV